MWFSHPLSCGYNAAMSQNEQRPRAPLEPETPDDYSGTLPYLEAMFVSREQYNDDMRRFEPLAQQAIAEKTSAEKREQEMRDRAQKDHNDKMMFRVTAIGVIAAFASVAITFWAARDTSENSRKALELQSASIDAQLLAMRTDERPFLGVEAQQIPQLITISSFGKTPALNVELSCLIRPDERDINWSDLAGNLLAGTWVYLLPNQKDGFICPHLTGDKSNGASSVVYGLVRYQDMQGTRYQTPFCISVIEDYRKKDGFRVSDTSPCSGKFASMPPLK